MNTDGHGLKHGELTREIIACSIEVLNGLGHGWLEKPYENAWVVEFVLRGMTYQQQPHDQVMYKDIPGGKYIPDQIVANKVVVDTKVVEHISDHEIRQMLNYFKITGLKIGMIINFRKARLEWKRVVV